MKEQLENSVIKSKDNISCNLDEISWNLISGHSFFDFLSVVLSHIAPHNLIHLSGVGPWLLKHLHFPESVSSSVSVKVVCSWNSLSFCFHQLSSIQAW